MPAFAQPPEKQAAKTVTFSKRLLMISPNEGCAIGDVNRDGKPDIVAGTHWYEAPDFVPHRLRDIPEMRDVYLVTNGDHLFDVDGDGWLDVVAGEWFNPEICWYKNPGKKDLQRGKLWKKQVLAKGRDANESFALKDFDGDGTPEVFVNCWDAKSPVVVWKFTKTDDGKPSLRRIVIGSEGGGHGLAWKDLDGDGRRELITGKRVRGHCGADPGGKNPAVLYYYTWDTAAKKFTRHTIAAPGENIGMGMQLCVADLNGDKKPDIAVGGKTGTWVLLNQGVK